MACMHACSGTHPHHSRPGPVRWKDAQTSASGPVSLSEGQNRPHGLGVVTELIGVAGKVEGGKREPARIWNGQRGDGHTVIVRRPYGEGLGFTLASRRCFRAGPFATAFVLDRARLSEQSGRAVTAAGGVWDGKKKWDEDHC